MESSAKAIPNAGVQLSALFLRSARFERFPSDEPFEDGQFDSTFSLGVGRPDQESLNVELSVSFEKAGTAHVELTYLAQFRKTEDAVIDNEDTFWRTVAAQVAPVVLYPYVRETVTTLTSRGGLPPLILPIVNFRAMFDPAEIAIPPIETDATSA